MHIVSLVYLHCHLFAQKYWFPLILTKASWTNGPTDRPHNRPRDRPSYRDARTHLKTYDEGSFHYEDCCFLFLQKNFWICMLHQWRERSREMMIWTCKSKWFYHSYAKRKKQSNHNGNKFGQLIDASFRPIFSTYSTDRRTDQQSYLPVEMQLYISVMFLGLPDDIHEEKSSFLQSKKTHYGPTDRPTDGPTDRRTDGQTLL